MNNKLVTIHKDLKVYQKAFSTAMQIFELSRKFPPRRDLFPDRPNTPFVALCVCQFGARHGESDATGAAFVAKLNDCVPEGLAEAAETPIINISRFHFYSASSQKKLGGYKFGQEININSRKTY